MILGVGHDLVHVPRVARLLARWQGRFLDRVFTAAELDYCLALTPAIRPQRLAARLAAKEACYKALSQGRSLGIWFRDIEVVRDASRAPRLVLSPRAQGIADAAGVTALHLSLSHDGEYASAFVVLDAAA